MGGRNITVGTMPKEGEDIRLPQLRDLTGNMLSELTTTLGVDRNVVASDDQIGQVWSQLSRLIQRIPQGLRNETTIKDCIIKACIAIASGLFDSAINYMWNAAVVELRQKVRRFGLQVILQIIDDKSFDERKLLNLRDAELPDLCLRLNLISDQNYFFLNQCRETRNNYSAAHPSSGHVSEDEVVGFISRCQEHALSNTQNPKGVDTCKFLISLKSSRFKKEQRDEWENRIRGTFDEQRELIFGMLHGIYCNPDSGEEARVNALSICLAFKDEFTSKTQSYLLDRHQDYKANGEDKWYVASQQFFEKLELASLLGEGEVHSLITSASRTLLRVHDEWNNFYNEPPFAERLECLSRNSSIPESAQAVFVEAVITCGIGNIYGVSNAAMPSYRAMVKSFSPKEIKIMLSLPKKTLHDKQPA